MAVEKKPCKCGGDCLCRKEESDIEKFLKIVETLSNEYKPTDIAIKKEKDS